MKKPMNINVNGVDYVVYVEPWDTLLTVLREQLHLLGTKYGCGSGDCGACTVLIDNEAYNSCLLPAVRVQGKDILTIEGLSTGESLHPLQEAFIESGAVQCGYCTPGMIMAAKALLDQNPDPSDEEIQNGLAGNICRCTGYKKIREAIRKASSVLSQEGS